MLDLAHTAKVKPTRADDRRSFAVVFALCLAFLWCLPVSTFAQQRSPKPLDFGDALKEGAYYVIPISGMIDKGLARYVDRALKDAAATGAKLVIFRIDTFGGLVDAADEIRQSILDAPMPTIAFIDRNAASAGALISYAADRIVMVPGASIGAATVVEGLGGDAAPDKYQSYMRGQMRATAEANGRDPEIAAAMVDESLEVEGVSEAGKVLTLSAEEALKLGVADAIIENFAALTTALDVTHLARVDHAATRVEEVLRFFGSPLVQSILMLMMMGGLYFELQTPGVGFPGLMALIGAALFFAPSYALGLAESWEIILFFIGVALIMVELFVTPGFGLPGIAGVILVVGALVVSLIANVGFAFPPADALARAIATVAVTLVLAIILMVSIGRYLPGSGRLSQLILAPELSSVAGYISAESDDSLQGRSGVTVTPLRPSGTAEIDGKRVDVIAAGEFVSAGEQIEVVRVRGAKVEVRPARRATNATS